MNSFKVVLAIQSFCLTELNSWKCWIGEQEIIFAFQRFPLNSTHTWMHRSSYSTFRILCFKIFCGSRYPAIQSNLLYLIHMGVNCNNVFALSCSSIIVIIACSRKRSSYRPTNVCEGWSERMRAGNVCGIWIFIHYEFWVLEGMQANAVYIQRWFRDGWLAILLFAFVGSLHLPLQTKTRLQSQRMIFLCETVMYRTISWCVVCLFGWNGIPTVHAPGKFMDFLTKL